MVTGPKLSTSRRSVSTSASRVRSQAKKRHATSCTSTSTARLSGSRPTSATFAPSAAKRWTIPRPMPELPPVTITTLPASASWLGRRSCRPIIIAPGGSRRDHAGLEVGPDASRSRRRGSPKPPPPGSSRTTLSPGGMAWSPYRAAPRRSRAGPRHCDRAGRHGVPGPDCAAGRWRPRSGTARPRGSQSRSPHGPPRNSPAPPEVGEILLALEPEQALRLGHLDQVVRA